MDYSALLNKHYIGFHAAVNSQKEHGKANIYGYGSKAIAKRFKEFQDQAKFKADPYTELYEVNPFLYQYDLEVFIFLYYDKLRLEELRLCAEKDRELIKQYGATGLSRHEHYLQACSIRWPSRELSDGSLAGNFIRTPWVEDTTKAICSYNNIIKFGGAGQGKTYDFIAFMCILYDYFIYTEKGAQCTFSTVSESKLKGSAWPIACKLYPVPDSREQFSYYAGKGKIGSDFTINRMSLDGKRIINKGGRFCGILLQKGRKDSSVIDKLTGSHDVIARAYLLDEMQATDDAPLSAYTNMFLHPLWGWFFGAGNYEKPGDLLAINVIPKEGKNTVNERTHVWEGMLKGMSVKLDLPSCIIHLNNDLSPAIATEEGQVKFKTCCPTLEDKERLYPTEASRNGYQYKRFWVGFFFEKEEINTDHVLTDAVIKMTGCNIKKNLKNPLAFGSFDSAPASKDRNVTGIFHLSDAISSSDTPFDLRDKIITGPFVNIERFIVNEKPSNPLEYYKHTTDLILKICRDYDIASSNFIMDWTNRTALIEELNKKGFVCHHLIYNEAPPSKIGFNEVSKERERPIELTSIKRFTGTLERQIKIYAHEKVKNKITLAAYIFSLFVENGFVGNINESLINSSCSQNNFEEEFLQRKFKSPKDSKLKDQRLILVSKDEFKDEFKFSPDILDTVFQFFYLLRVIKEVNINTKSIEFLRQIGNKNKLVDETADVWHSNDSDIDSNRDEDDMSVFLA